MGDFTTGLRTRYAQQVAAGLHDERCEWRANGHFICNCAKRARIASGFVYEPSELYFLTPSCSHCSRILDFDGDCWVCNHCHVAWNSDGTDARFTDDHGTDESLAAAAAYDARAAEFHATTDDRRSPKEIPTA